MIYIILAILLWLMLIQIISFIFNFELEKKGFVYLSNDIFIINVKKYYGGFYNIKIKVGGQKMNLFTNDHTFYSYIDNKQFNFIKSKIKITGVILVYIVLEIIDIEK